MNSSATITNRPRPHRIAPQPGEAIDRSKTITFRFDGREYSAHPGDTIASALAAAGVKVFSRSFKYHRPRGLLCCAGHCPNCLVQVGDEPNVRACRHAVAEGVQVRHQNAWPSLDHDLMSLTQLGDPFLPVGFYYKTFIRPNSLWPVYEHVLRLAAGLGEVHQDARHGEFSKQYLHTDVAVIGGGPAGITAARAAAEHGAQVMLFDENASLGGHLRYTPARRQELLVSRPNLTVYTDTTVLGWYLDQWLAALHEGRLLKIRAKSVVVAAGAYEMPLVFDNNDLPGVMLGSAVQRLINLYGIAPGPQAVVVTGNDDGWAVAADLQAAGVAVAAVVDERTRDEAGPPAERLAGEVPTFWQHTLLAARGTGAVSGAVVARAIGEHGADEAHAQTLNCDLIAVSMGWTPALDLFHQAGGKAAYDEARGEALPVSLPPGVYVAGRAAGTHAVETQVEEGRLAGVSAAAFAGHGRAPGGQAFGALAGQKAAEPRRTSTRVSSPGHKKRFVCFCEDVTVKDVETAIAEGYDSLELLKRYSTLTMGPCQGKMCAANGTHLCARANGWTVEQTGATTVRQPTIPVSLGSLAGQHMAPLQVTPIHAWHVARGAKTMIAGLWLRPLHYGDPAIEIRAVRERVGLIDVSTLGKLRLTGPGVPALLERLYVNQWRGLSVGRVRYGVMCSDEGVVLDDGVCARVGEREWYMTTTTSGASAIFEWIQWWVQSGWGEGVHVTQVAEAFAAFNLAGPRARDVLRKCLSPEAGPPIENAAFPYMHVRDMEVAGVPCRLLRIGFTGELSYEIHVPAAYSLHVWEVLMTAGEEFGILPFGVEAQRVLRLEKGHVIVGQDTDAITDPLAADMGWVVKLDKADFLGKRSLARIAAAGPKQRLAGFKMARSGMVPEEGLQIVRSSRTDSSNGGLEIIGHITSCKYSPTLGETIGLCWLPADLAAQPGATFLIRMNAETLEEGRVHHGPFYDPKGERLKGQNQNRL